MYYCKVILLFMIVLAGSTLSVSIVFCILAVSIIIVTERITRINNIVDLLVEENKWVADEDKNINANFIIKDNNELEIEFYHKKLNKTETEFAKYKKDYLSGVIILTSDKREDTGTIYQKNGKLYVEANKQVKIFTKI